VLVACASGSADDGAGGPGDGPASTGPDAGSFDDAAPSPSGEGGAPGATGGGGADSGPAPGLDAGNDSSSPLGGGTNDGGPVPLDASGDGASASDAAPSSALIGKWSFDEGTGTTSADLSGHGHAATLVGGASWAAAGKEGTGLALDGVTGYADVGIPLIDTAASFSVLSWVKLSVANSWEIAVSQDDVNGSLFGLKLRGDATNAFDFDVETSDSTNPGFIVAQSTTTAVAASWFHLGGVYDATGGGTLKIYVNGALQANAAIGQSVLAASGHLVIGRGLYNGAEGSFLNGVLDEVEVYGGALTSAEVAAVYTAEE
jgi:hypothetical protein